MTLLRGNVGTRLDKVQRGEVDATLLALAGLKRLGLADRATAVLDTDDDPAGGRPGGHRDRGARRRHGDARCAA